MLLLSHSVPMLRISCSAASRPASSTCRILSLLSRRASKARQVTNVRRRGLLVGTFVGVLGIASEALAEKLACRGRSGYDLRQCLSQSGRVSSCCIARENRKTTRPTDEDLREEYLQTRQFEQPGDLVTLPNGLQYREMETGSGQEIRPGAQCSISYIVYRLSSGAYFKYSSGGTPIYLFSMGYGYEGKDDVDSIYQFQYGDPEALPLAAALGMQGMQVGGRRRILIPPRYGWRDQEVGPQPDTFGGYRRLEAHKDEPLLFEVELKRVQPPSDDESSSSSLPDKTDLSSFRLPVPPPPTQK